MAQMGRFCKAYPLKRLREFQMWTERWENARKEKQQVNAQELETTRILTDDTIVYLQENYIVTDNIYIDENIIFADVTPEWKNFCQQTLQFSIPAYEPDNI